MCNQQPEADLFTGIAMIVPRELLKRWQACLPEESVVT
jgi:hypothetical protein